MKGSRMFLAALAAGAAVGVAHAEFTAVDRHSYVLAFEHLYNLEGDYLGTVQSEQEEMGFAPFVSTVSAGGYTAMQDSSFDATSISVQSTAFGNPMSMGWGQGVSFFSLTFDVASTMTYRLEGTFARFIGNSSISLIGPGTQLVHNPYDYPAQSFLYEGVLGPGRYTFETRAESDFGSLSASLTIVPAPSVLFATAGLLAVPLRRRRRA